MDRTIYKYPLKWREVSFDSKLTLRMPQGASPIAVQMQNGEPMLWAVVNPGNPETDFTIYVVGTGHVVPSAADRHLGTVQIHNLVLHFFARVGEG